MFFLHFLQAPPTTHLQWEQVSPQHPMDSSAPHLHHLVHPHSENMQVCQAQSGSVALVFSAKHQLSCVWHHTTVHNTWDLSTYLCTHCMHALISSVGLWNVWCTLCVVRIGCSPTHAEVSRCRVSILVHRHLSSLLTAHAWWNNHTQCVYFSVVNIAKCCHWSLAMYTYLKDFSDTFTRQQRKSF